MAAKKKATKKAARRPRATRASAPAKKSKKPYTIEGTKVIRHHKDGEDSTQHFTSEEAAKEYAASIPEEA